MNPEEQIKVLQEDVESLLYAVSIFKKLLEQEREKNRKLREMLVIVADGE